MKAQLIPDNWLQLMTPDDRKKLGRHGMTIQEIIDKTSAKSERALHKAVGGLLRLRGIEYVESRMDRKTTQKRGVPDFLFAVNGQACAWEIKMPHGKLSEEQRLMLSRLSVLPNFWEVAVIRSVDQALIELKRFGL